MDASTWAEYVNGLSNASLLAQAELFERCELLRAEGLSPEGLRDALLELTPAVIERYASLAALAASEYYEANREAAIGVSEVALLAEGPDPVAIEGSVRYAAGSVFEKGADEGLDEASNYLAGIVDKHVKGAARNTIAANVADDRRKGRKARYGRVPDAGACEFCRMLGSRGFVYHSKDLAGGDRWHGTEMDSYHPFCNCQVAVSYDVVLDEYWEGMVKVTRGYAGTAAVSATGRDGSRELRESDMEELFAQYQGFKDKFKLNPSKAVNRRARERKALRRDIRRSPLRDAETAGDVLEYVDGAAANYSDIQVRYDRALEWAQLHGDQGLRAMLQAARAERLGMLKTHNAVGAMKAHDRPSSNVILPGKRFGKKLRRHAKEWGLDPSVDSDRARLYSIIETIIDEAEEVVVGTTWQMQPQPCTFFRRNEDVVIVNAEDEFVTILKGGVRNRRFLRAREEALHDRNESQGHQARERS